MGMSQALLTEKYRHTYDYKLMKNFGMVIKVIQKRSYPIIYLYSTLPTSTGNMKKVYKLVQIAC